MQILIATTNVGKAREFREMLTAGPIDWSDLTGRSIDAPDETGHTFRANASLKAAFYARHFHTWTLADDSGLAVDALDGKPGVHSARWAVMHHAGTGNADNNQLLLQQLNDVPQEQRTARFVCVLALSDPAGRIVFTARGTVQGHILREARGSNGFGYDPLFLVEGTDLTMAELGEDEKNRISHRALAIKNLRLTLEKTLAERDQLTRAVTG